MLKARFLLAVCIIFALIFGFEHSAYSWPWSKKDSNTTQTKQGKKKKESKKKHKKNKKGQKHTR